MEVQSLIISVVVDFLEESPYSLATLAARGCGALPAAAAAAAARVTAAAVAGAGGGAVASAGAGAGAGTGAGAGAVAAVAADRKDENDILIPPLQELFMTVQPGN